MSTSIPTHTIQQLRSEDIPVIEAIALVSWKHTYTTLLSEAQLDYMLNEIYTPAALQQQMTQEQHVFHGLRHGNEIIGFASYSRVANSDTFKIHKLYLLPAYMGQGNGSTFLFLLEENIKKLGGKKLLLNVNRNNPALQFYEKRGYKIHSEVDLPFGEFWLNDYILGKDLL